MNYDLQYYVRKVVNLGTRSQHLYDQPVTRLINGICLLAAVTVIVAQIMLTILSGFEFYSFLMSSLYITLFSVLLYLNYREKWEVSKKLLLVFTFLMVASLHFSFPYEVSSWIFFICIFAFYAAVFKTRKEILIYSVLLLAFTAVSMVLQNSPSHKTLIQYSRQEVLGLQFIIFTCSSAFVVLIVLFVKANLVDHQQRLEKVLAERSLLLKEVHHRVKNNLQVVSSLFNLQERRISPSNLESLGIINSSQGRIQSMALVHQQLYDSPNLKTIEIKSYIENLVHHLQGMYSNSIDSPMISLDLDDSSLPLETVIPVGLIVNEALTNAFKHAFDERSKGKIEIVYHQANDVHTFSIQDNGIGYTGDNKNKKGIGNQLIADMADQLYAEYELTTTGGVKHMIKFRLRDS